MPHHLRANEWCEFREGIVVSSSDGGVTVDTGLPQKSHLRDIQLPESARVTVRVRSHGDADTDTAEAEAEPQAVHPSTPRTEAGYYWGYYIRRTRSLSDVFTECPFDGGYDLSVGTSERGEPVSSLVEQTGSNPNFKHLLVVFGGVAGIEAAVKNDRQLREMGVKPGEAEKLFDHWVNLLPGQGSRTIRTEEAVWLGLTGLRGLVERK